MPESEITDTDDGFVEIQIGFFVKRNRNLPLCGAFMGAADLVPPEKKLVRRRRRPSGFRGELRFSPPATHAPPWRGEMPPLFEVAPPLLGDAPQPA